MSLMRAYAGRELMPIKVEGKSVLVVDIMLRLSHKLDVQKSCEIDHTTIQHKLQCSVYYTMCHNARYTLQYNMTTLCDRIRYTQSPQGITIGQAHYVTQSKTSSKLGSTNYKSVQYYNSLQ